MLPYGNNNITAGFDLTKAWDYIQQDVCNFYILQYEKMKTINNNKKKLKL